MKKILIFGMGYSANVLARHLRARDWDVIGIKRTGGDNILAFDDRTAISRAIKDASHILSSVPPGKDGREPVLDAYGQDIAKANNVWTGYLSSTGVYGDTGGAWVDESAALGSGRRPARTQADLRWQQWDKNVHIFRLPGIYGPGRSALERVQSGKARRVDVPGQIFSRIHVDDIARGVIASLDRGRPAGPAAIYNLADDYPAPQNDVIACAAELLGLPVPPLQKLQDADLSPAARAFYDENRRVVNGKARRDLGWRPLYPDYRSGLRAIVHQQSEGDG